MKIKNVVLFIIAMIVVLVGSIFWLGRIFVLTTPFIWIFISASIFWYIFTPLGQKGGEKPDTFIIPDKFRIYFTIALTVIALLSVLVLSEKTILRFNGMLPPTPTKNIIPPIIVVSAITLFIAITIYMKKFYPYSVIFSSALLFIVYASSLRYILPYFTNSPIGFLAASFIAVVPIIVIAASWHHEKLGWVYPFTLSIVFGIFTGASVISEEGFELLGTVFIAIPLIFFSGLIALILYGLRSKSKPASEYFNSSLKVFLSLILYLISLVASLLLIFRHFYQGL